MKKSVARSASAGPRRNCAHVGPAHRGAGGIPAAVRISYTVEAASWMPRPASSPWIRSVAPACVSRARRNTSVRARFDGYADGLRRRVATCAPIGDGLFRIP